MIGISLGHNCAAAAAGVGLRLRGVKANGYMTCPFDEMNSSYEGMVKCLEEDFAHFADPSDLNLVERPTDCAYYPGETLLCNTRYGFIFNHESPGHADLYKTQAWTGGKMHYVDDSFRYFRERYGRRIENFRTYCRSGGAVTLLISSYPRSFDDLLRIMRTRYPMTTFVVHRLDINNDVAWAYHMDLMGKITQPTSSSSPLRASDVTNHLADAAARESSRVEAVGCAPSRDGSSVNQSDQSVS